MLTRLFAPLIFFLVLLTSLPASAQRFCPDPSNAGPCVAITASSGNAVAGAATATLAAVTGKTTYISGFEITGSGATAAGCVLVTVTGTITGTLTYSFCQPAIATTIGSTPLTVTFIPAIPASALNTTIAVTVTGGAGTTFMATVAHGYQL